MSRKMETLDEYLNNNLDINNKIVKQRKFKKIKVVIAAVTLSIVSFVSCHFIGKDKNKGTDVPKNNISTETLTNTPTPSDVVYQPTVTPTPSSVVANKDINDIGVELDFQDSSSKEENKYKNPSNDKIDTNKIVEDKKNTLWKDEEAKKESNNIGKTEIDTKDDSLIVKDDGKVYEKEEGYEIQNKDGNVISSGNVDKNGIPDGYVEDPKTGDLYKENDVYVDPDGNCWDNKEKYESYLKSLKETEETHETTIIPVEDTKEDNSTNLIDDGVVNSNGTYTIYGTTYESKEDFEQFLLTPDEYGYYNGMIMSLESINKLTEQKSLVK